MELYKKEEIIHINKIPAKIIHQQLSGSECSVGMHWHKDIEINLMLLGEAEFTVDGKMRELHPGEFNIINSGDIHQGTAPLNIPVQERYQELITILWDYDFLHGYLDHLDTLRFQMPKDEFLIKEIRSRLISIGTAYLQRGIGFEMDISATLLQIGSLLLKNCVSNEENVSSNTIKRNVKSIQDVVSYIEGHCAEDLSLDKIADYMNFTPNYFSRKFRQMTGTTYHEYLVDCRLKKSLIDLKNTNLSSTEIAYKNGFPNVKSFIEHFKKNYGTTPQQFRKSW
ncbi:MAG: AraC family transcriptional regulator [Clostridia bacterium]|nr:AraC family transcriptional regulator [Clostridia bacterium]